MNPLAPPCILFQPPNHVGLGHISRLAAIALSLRRLEPAVRVPFAVEGSSHQLLESLGLPFVPLPSAHDLFKNGAWQPWTGDQRNGLALDICRAILARLAPQVVVFDCFPFMAMATAAVERRIRMVLCLREMKDTAAHLDTLRRLQPHLDAVLLPHDCASGSVPEPWRSRVRLVGTIARPAERPPVGEQAPRIVVTGGGGGGAGVVDFYNLALQALAEFRALRPGVECLLVAGPLFLDWRSLRLVDGVRVLPFAADLPSLLASADLVICNAGYNTTAEVAQAGAPTICIPAERYYDDQHARAEQYAREHPLFRVWRGPGSAGLASVIRESMDSGPPGPPPPAPPGGPRAAQFLLDFLYSRDA